MVHVRGSPYSATFVPTAKPADNTMNGALMQANFKQETNDLNDYMTKKDKAISVKGKDINEVNTLLTVKQEIEEVFKNEGSSALKID